MLDVDRPRSLVISETPDAAAADLSGLLGGRDAVLVLGPDALSDWPDYVSARARTGGALVSNAGDAAARDPRFMSLADGTLLGRPATAGLVAGALVFVLASAASAGPAIAEAA